jgi:hypothetical protein
VYKQDVPIRRKKRAAASTKCSSSRNGNAICLAPYDLDAVFIEPHGYAVHFDERLTNAWEYLDSLNRPADQRTSPFDALVGFPSPPNRLPNRGNLCSASTGFQKLNFAIDARKLEC